MPPITDCAHGERNALFPSGATCLAFIRSPVRVFVPSGILLTTIGVAFHGMLYMAQCWPVAMFSPSVVSMNVSARDLVPAGTAVAAKLGEPPRAAAPP